jgi:LPS export ABC transporter protein LptC
LIYRLLILLGLALVGVAVWLTLSPRQAEPVTAQNSGPTRPDAGYAAIDASMVETGADGLPLYTLQAQQVQQDPDTNIINLSTVHMTFRDPSGGLWQGRADRAQASQDAEQIDLAGSIDVSGTFAGSDKPAQILTEKLHIDTRSDVIRTRSPYTLNWAGIVVTAQGLVVDTKDHNVKLE